MQDRIAKNCENWTNGVCQACGVQWQDCQVGADYRCPHFRPRQDHADLAKALKAVTRSLIGAISIIEHTPECRKAMPSDKMFDQMLADMKKNLEQARKALP